MQRRGRYHALEKERTMLLRCESLEPPMSQLGQTRSLRHACVTSGLPLIADMRRTGLDVGFVPIVL
jgi:hypothetical protein